MSIVTRSIGTGLAVLVGLGIAAALAAALYLDTIVERAVESGTQRALGVGTELGWARVAPLSGGLALSSFEVANPEGFARDPFLSLGSAELQLDLGSLRRPVVEVPLIRLEGLTLALERRPGSRETNVQGILRNLGRYEAGNPPAEREEPAKRFVVRELRIADVEARIRALRELGEQHDRVLKIPEIRLRNLGSGGSRGVLVSQLTDIVVKAVLEAVARHGVDLPGLLQATLRNELARLGDVQVELIGAATAAGESAIERARDEVEKGIGSVGGEVERGIEEAARGLTGWLGELGSGDDREEAQSAAGSDT